MLLRSIVNFTRPELAQGIKISSPATGNVVPVETLPGSNMAMTNLGQGVAIKLEGHGVNSPINGQVIEYIPSYGKLIIQAKNKLRFLLQLPIESIKFNGLGIQPLIKLGQNVTIGQPLLLLDLYKLQQMYKPVLLYVLLLDHKKFKAIDVPHKHVVVGEDPIFSLIPRPIKEVKT